MLNLLWTIPASIAAGAVYLSLAPIAARLSEILNVLPV